MIPKMKDQMNLFVFLKYKKLKIKGYKKGAVKKKYRERVCVRVKA